LVIISEVFDRNGLVMQPDSIDIPGIHASEIIENSRLFMWYDLRMLILAYLNVSKIIKLSFVTTLIYLGEKVNGKVKSF
jgi:hypothetical protein